MCMFGLNMFTNISIHYSPQATMAYLCDFFDMLNTLNRQLQGKESNLIAHSACISGFVAKLALWRKRTQGGAIDSFHCLSVAVGDSELHPDIKNAIVEHLECVEEEFMHYFPDLDEAADPWMKIIRNPFQRQLAEIPRAAQEEFLELTTIVRQRTLLTVANCHLSG